MEPAVARLLFLHLFSGPSLVVDSKLQSTIKDFYTLNIDFPKVAYPKGFQGYCNGLMAYVRGRKQSWFCPKIHYGIHAAWKTTKMLCKHSDSFCEDYNEYCTLTQVSFPLTVCSLFHKQPPTSCRYDTTKTNKRLYLLCSKKV